MARRLSPQQIDAEVERQMDDEGWPYQGLTPSSFPGKGFYGSQPRRKTHGAIPTLEDMENDTRPGRPGA
jgi:hypothetical protein